MPKIVIKNMVCRRCILSVTKIFEELSIPVSNIILGEVSLTHEISDKKIKLLRAQLIGAGFDIADDRVSKTIEQIKTLIIEEIFYSKKQKNENENYSNFLERKIGYEYSHISGLFSSTAGMTIEKFIIAQKIERVKELLIYDEFSLSEISWQLEYSTVQHLSVQFKKITGITPTEFKSRHIRARRFIDDIS